ncbi:YceI family protein [Bremerella alba]|uniref:Protein YceI n=1 Tax=Bremerella alba TaxID=980252 RepID=A0A7V8V428_9BACT|nr:YceI family protein [Bremerella alba]MBA2114525.1 Protein YceI [Bremerella alba]
MRFLGLVLVAAIAFTGCKPPSGDSGTPSSNETTTPAATNETVPAPVVTPAPTEEAPPAAEEKPEMKKEEPAPPMETPKEEPAPAPEAPPEEMKKEEVKPEAAAQPAPAEEVEGLTDKASADKAPKETAPKEKAPEAKPAEKPAPEEKPADKPAPEEAAEMKKPAEETKTIAAEASGPVEVKLTPENTLIQFVGIHKGDKPDPRTGKFGKLSGTAKAADGKLTEVNVLIETPSLETEIEKLTNHLKSPDFFDVRENPEAKFVSKSIETADDGTVKITGDLTLLKETKSISFPAKVTVGKDITLDAEFVINRVDFGMDFGTDNVHEDVTMTIKVGK